MTWKIVADSGCDYRQLPTLATDAERSEERRVGKV